MRLKVSSMQIKNIIYTFVQREVNLTNVHHHEEEDITKLFHINVQVKKTNIDALFDSDSQANIITMDLVNKLRLQFHDHTNPYLQEQVKNNEKINVMKQCKIKFVASVNYSEEVEIGHTTP